MKVKLICFEGPNGVGKGTILNLLARDFESKGRSIRTFKDSEYPEMIEIRRKIREGFISEPFEIMRLVAEAKQQVYSRYLNLEAESRLIFLDRGYYTGAVLHYQENLPISRIIGENLKLGLPVPDQTFILMAPLEVLMKRVANRSRIGGRKYSAEFLNKQIRGYLEIARDYKECVLVDNSGPMSLALDKIKEILA